MAPSPPDASRTRGRPVEIDRAHVAQVALQLFEERGYDDVSAAEIASTAGISRRSLFRYFPTKADLVWEGFGDALEALDAALAAGEGEPIEAAVAGLILTAEQTPSLSLTRARLKIIASHRELFSVGTGRLQDQSTVIRTYLAGRDFDEIQSRVVASALSVASFHGYLLWATTDSEEHPAAVVRQALTALSLL